MNLLLIICEKCRTVPALGSHWLTPPAPSDSHHAPLSGGIPTKRFKPAWMKGAKRLFREHASQDSESCFDMSINR